MATSLRNKTWRFSSIGSEKSQFNKIQKEIRNKSRADNNLKLDKKVFGDTIILEDTDD